MMPSKFFATTLAAAGLVTVLSPSVQAFTFVEIASSQTANFTDLVDAAYAINDLGTVTFLGELDGQNGVFAGDGGVLATIADEGDGFLNFSDLDINSAGTVVFSADGNTRIVSSSGGLLTDVITVGSSPGLIGFSAADGLFAPVINELGTIAFFAENFATTDEGIFTINGGGVSTIADGPDFDLFRFSLNNNDEVAFFSISALAPDGDALFIGDGTAAPAPFADPLGFGTNEGPVLNDTGTVAFNALFLDAMFNPVLGNFRQGPGGLELVVDDQGPFSTLGRPAINNAGTLVFQSGLDAGAPALFVGPDPVADRVIGVGDMLFGSTITSINFQERNGLNNQGQFVFTAQFEDGSSGVFRADPSQPPTQDVPEPTSWLGLMAIAAFAVKRKQKL